MDVSLERQRLPAAVGHCGGSRHRNFVLGATAPSPAATTTRTPSTPAAAAPSVSSTELADNLPDAGTLQALLLMDPLARTADAETTYTGVSTDRPDCGGAPNVALPAAYDRSGYTAIRTQEFFTQPGPDGQDSVTQAVAAFPSDQHAKDFVALENSRWGNCKFDLVTITNPDGDAIVRQMSSPNSRNGVLTLSIHSQMRSKVGCQRGLSSQRNIVIDVQICSRSGSAQAAKLVSTIADRIPDN
ncbi:sensor domain-containing protein [Mycolicibacterium farcinogenes]|nr:sensor domain-containing protein [Mycolicibacterium farcinogenes]